MADPPIQPGFVGLLDFTGVAVSEEVPFPMVIDPDEPAAFSLGQPFTYLL